MVEDAKELKERYIEVRIVRSRRPAHAHPDNHQHQNEDHNKSDDLEHVESRSSRGASVLGAVFVTIDLKWSLAWSDLGVSVFNRKRLDLMSKHIFNLNKRCWLDVLVSSYSHIHCHFAIVV